MSKPLQTGTVALAGALVAAGALACEMPSMVDVPDGATATEEQMVQARQAVTDYVASMDEYLACVDQEMAAEGDDAPEEYKALMTQRYNAAISEIETVAAAFNEQLRAYREANESQQEP